MRALLDENIPLGLARQLRADGWEVDHPILSGRRGLPDAHFAALVEHESDVVFLTQDSDFELATSPALGQLVVSRVRQTRPLAQRLEIWAAAFESLRVAPRLERRLKLLDDGRLIPLQIVSGERSNPPRRPPI